MELTNSFLKALDKIESRVSHMKEQVSVVRSFYTEGNLRGAYEQALKLEENSERTVLLTRVLPAYSGCRLADMEVQNIMALSIPVEIGYTAEGWFSIRIPALLPKKVTGSADYVRSFLYPAMQEFFREKPPVRYRNCVLIFRHVYDRTRPERQRRDHDNIEVNMVSDIVALYTMPDDGPGICSHHYCSAEGSADRTEVYVVPRDQFPIWLITEKAMPDEGVILHEERL